MSQLPPIIQGGMGVGVSGWRLAQAVSRLGQLGVVSGTALDQVFARRLQDGDPGGHMRRGLDQFPFSRMAERIWDTYFIRGGKAADAPYKVLPALTKDGPRERQELCIAGNFVEVFLARQGHANPVGVNYLEKIQIPHLPSLYGAMLAGVAFVLMGAGVPLKIPGAMDLLARHEPAAYTLHVEGALEGDDRTIRFVPREFMERDLPPLERPMFLAIIASNTLALTMVKKANGRVDGFVIEGPTAGGHNAPPRGKPQFDAAGEVIYGERDRVDLEKIRELDLPFWLAGGYGAPEMLCEARAAGAAGIQAGTAFAFCEESSLRDDCKRTLLELAASGRARVLTDSCASPTGFPFKVAELQGSLSEPGVYADRPRLCDLGYLRQAYRTDEGAIGFRCPGEPVTSYVAKGGNEEDTVGKKCLCNALLANIGHAQIRSSGYVEPDLVTAGNDLTGIARFLSPHQSSYTAADVVAKLLDGLDSVAG